jgi:hypothetical protein
MPETELLRAVSGFRCVVVSGARVADGARHRHLPPLAGTDKSGVPWTAKTRTARGECFRNGCILTRRASRFAHETGAPLFLT